MEIGSIATSQELETAHARGRLRLERTSLDEATADEDIIGFAESMAGYDQIMAERAAAVTDLLDVAMVPDEVCEQAYAAPYRWTSWHYRDTTTAAGLTIPTAYEVTLNTYCGDLVANQAGDQNGSYRDKLLFDPVTVKVHAIHPLVDGYSGQESRHMTGHLIGNVIFDSDVVSATVEEDAIKRDLKTTLISRVRTELTAAGIKDEMAGWVDSYIEACHLDQEQGATPDIVDSTDRCLRLKYGDHIRTLLVSKTGSPENALAKLMHAFASDYTGSIHSMLGVPLRELTKDLDEVKATNRYMWLTQNLTQIRTQLRDTLRAKVINDFATTFAAHLEIERAKIKEIKDLAASLSSETVCINDCRPSNERLLDLC